jgi:hypothetical protein
MLEVFFMAEKATVFGRMALRQRGNAVGIMAFTAEFLRCLFPCHFVESIVNFVMGQPCCGLLRGVPEKKEQAAAEKDKEKIVYQNVFALWGFSQFRVLLQVLF